MNSIRGLSIFILALAIGLPVASAQQAVSGQAASEQEYLDGEAAIAAQQQSRARLVEGGSDRNAGESGRISFDLMAVNQPEELEGKPIIDDDGAEIGRIEKVVRKTSDNSLHVVVNTGTGSLAALLLNDLQLDAFVFGDLDGSLPEQVSHEEDFVPVNQAQSGHSSQASLSPSTAQPEPSGAAAELESPDQVPADQAPAEPARQNPVAQTYMANSSMVQIAMIQADALKGKALDSGAGEEFGKITQVVRKTSDNDLYALIDSGAGAPPTAVRIEDLRIGRFLYEAGEKGLRKHRFEEGEYTATSR